MSKISLKAVESVSESIGGSKWGAKDAPISKIYVIVKDLWFSDY